MDESSLKVLLAQGASVEEIGRRFDRHPSTVAYWMRKHGLEAPNRDRHVGRGALGRERLAELVAEGRSIAEIAVAVDRSKGTVRHWLRTYGLATRGGRQRTQLKEARRAGRLTVRRTCRIHGDTDFVLEGRGQFRCRRCRQERVARHRRRLKSTLVAEAGGACVRCGYDRYLGALQFHHLDPAEKLREINCSGATLSLAALRVEAARCVVLCANCHAEVESGIPTLALK